MLNVRWIKLTTGNWPQLLTVNLDGITTGGVYVIWRSGNPGPVIRVGQGDIKARLCAHRLDKQILDYGEQGTLHVTWAAVPAAQRDGVERFLADQYKPLVGDAFPNVAPIQVNLVA